MRQKIVLLPLRIRMPLDQNIAEKYKITLIYLFGSQAEKAGRYLEDAEIKTDEFSADEFEEMVMKKGGDLAFKKRILIKEILEAVKDGYFEFGHRPAAIFLTFPSAINKIQSPEMGVKSIKVSISIFT